MCGITLYCLERCVSILNTIEILAKPTHQVIIIIKKKEKYYVN